MSRARQLGKLLEAPPLDLEAVAALLEEAPPGERTRLMEGIDGRGQARLWEAAAGGAVSVDELVPRELGPMVPVIYHGKNSLPAFTRFQKRFCRPAGANPANELWGYNHQPTRWLAPLTGPGYFVAVDAPDGPGSVAVDYRRVPAEHPPGWPAIHDNRYRLSRFIYQGLVDYLRRISDHLLIGRATRNGKVLENTFLLCRDDPA